MAASLHRQGLQAGAVAPQLAAAVLRLGELRRRQVSTGRPSRRRQSRPPPAPAAPPQQWEPAALAARLYRLLSEEERLLAVSEQSAAAVLRLLHELHFSEQQVSELLLGRPALLRRGPAAWRAAVPPLLGRGCAPHQLADMLAACPALLERRGAELEATLAALLAALPAGEWAVLELVHRQPQLLLLPAGRLRRQLARLLTVFTVDQAARVALRCPAALLERGAETERKLDYLLDTMGLTPAEVAHSSAMEWPLEHLRARHTALERSGGYRRPRAKDTEPTGNPAPTEMFSHSDELFCQRVARLPYREYEVFTRLLEEEQEEAQLEESDSDSDSDSDSEDSDSSHHSRGRRPGR
ncbi:Transcription termination factor 4, mitochondrial [Amphibalanus amphitrite]|uniref:Transcription termination factor 4, mitochondrial n=1 Tax=Amphibalanus amphitrite TaxID=1232801 RepID=A0A6A4VFV2_AMPAM|nr:Transcription termination factor 4, mitochondrial [Amphibalanus amphitrite]